MKLYSVVLLFFLVSIYENGILAQDLCQTCICEPPHNPITVDCRCNDQTQAFDFQHKYLTSAFSETINFTVSDCTGPVKFIKQSFKELHHLENLNLNSVKEVTFSLGVFHHLNRLKIRNVANLRFGSRAFMGSELKGIEIYNSSIQGLPVFALYNIKNLEKFVLDGVTINYVEANAINLTNSDKVNIINTTMKNIATNGITIQANSTIIYQSSFLGLYDDAVNLTAKSEIVISETKFDDQELGERAIQAFAHKHINISNNQFHNLNKDTFQNIKVGDSKGIVTFANNSFEKSDGDGLLNEFPTTWDIRGNIFQCTCDFLEDLKDSAIPKNNYCNSTCLVTLNTAEKNCPSTTFEVEDLCKDVSSTATKPLPLTPKTREGRLIGDDTTNSTDPKNNSNRFSSMLDILFWSLITLRVMI